MYRHTHKHRVLAGMVFAMCALCVLTFVPGAAAAGNPVQSGRGTPGAVYTATNSADGNAILAYTRSAHGVLNANGSYETGGLGTGGGLGNQGGVALSDDHHHLFVVNAGSNDISAFEVTGDGLMLTDVEPSLGEMPVSVTVNGDLLYVLNAGGAGGIQGFTVAEDGDLMPIADSMRPLSGAEVTAAAQIGFGPDGTVLAVTEKATSLIDTYLVNEDGTTMGPNSSESSGMTPFGFDYTSRGALLVSEAFGGMPGLSAASSYGIGMGGELDAISPSVPSSQTAACWLVVNPNSRHAYVTNTGSGTISGYTVYGDDSIELLDEDGLTFDLGEGTAPIDAAFATNGRFLYVLNSGTHEITALRVNKSDGSLSFVQTVSDLPMSTNGLAAH